MVPASNVIVLTLDDTTELSTTTQALAGCQSSRSFFTLAQRKQKASDDLISGGGPFGSAAPAFISFPNLSSPILSTSSYSVSALNEKSIPDAYPIPSIIEILNQLGSAKYFSVFDCKSGFHQVGMDEGDAEKTAFSTPYGRYEYVCMPFGLRNASATFQRLMDAVFIELQGFELFLYLDGIVIYARSLAEHYGKFLKLTERLRYANIKLEP